MSYQRISVEKAMTLLQSETTTLLDIRDEHSFQVGNIQGSIHLSNENVEAVVNDLDKENPVIIYCYHGNSSQGAADYFYNLGFKQSFSVDGGYEVWKLVG